MKEIEGNEIGENIEIRFGILGPKAKARNVFQLTHSV